MIPAETSLEKISCNFLIFSKNLFTMSTFEIFIVIFINNLTTKGGAAALEPN